MKSRCRNNKMVEKEHPNILVLFDVDGTLSPSRLQASDEMLDLLKQLKTKVYTGFVGGSNLVKQEEQLKGKALELFDYAFSENGLLAYKNGELFHTKKYIDFVGMDRHKVWVNTVLRKLADIDIPIKTGTFIEYRTGMVNISPIGRNCSQDERIEFFEADKAQKFREKMCNELASEFPDYGLKYSIGGQISIDVFPIGWDKTYCLQHIEDMKFEKIYFFGDRTQEGGNDFEIYHDPRVTDPITVKTPEETFEHIKRIFF